jgi:selenocysteine lyase/cysteine desulfurase
VNIDVAAQRRRFATLAHKTYLNTGSYGLLAPQVSQAYAEYLASREALGADWDTWLARVEAVRARMGRLLNADGDEIAVTASASAGMASIASALDPTGPRRRIVVSDFEFPTSGQIWHAQEPRGFRVEHVPEDAQGFIPVEHFERAIDDTTAVVAIPLVCYRNGAALDVAQIVRIAHERGALVLLDCYQGVGVSRVDVQALGVDFAVGGMLKYLLGSAGIGFLYAQKGVIPRLTPTVTGWFAQAEPGAMDIHQNVPAATARRFQAGTPPIPSCYAAAAGLDIILELGVDQIQTHVRNLTGHCMDRLLAAGCRITTPRADARRGPQVAIRSTDDHALVAALAARNIVTSCRDGNVRATFHFYNNEADVDALLEGLLKNEHLLAR